MMLKKFSLIFSLTMAFSLLLVNQDFAQVNKTVTKNKTVVKTTSTATRVVAKKDNAIYIKISTDSGVMIVKLYDSTPLHRDNFVKLVKQGFYDSLMFHRVIPTFMIQGGDPTSKYAPAGIQLGNGGDSMTRIPAEFRKTLFHKRGVLAAARDNNPEKASSACQFYLVQGKKLTDTELDGAEMQMGKKFTPAERNVYKTIGGAPWLDQNYTVFGEVVSGMEVIDKIAGVPRDAADRPLGDIRMHMEVIKFMQVVK